MKKFKHLIILSKWLTAGHKKKLFLLAMITVAGALAEIATMASVMPFLQAIIDPTNFAEGKPAEPIPSITINQMAAPPVAAVATAFSLVVMLAAVLRLYVVRETISCSEQVGHEIAVKVLEGTLRKPYEYHLIHNSAEAIAAVGKVDEIARGVINAALEAATSLIIGLALLVGMIIIDWRLAVGVAVAFGGIYIGIVKLSARKIKRNATIISTSLTDRVKAVQEALGGIRDIILEGSAGLHIQEFQHKDHELRSAVIQNGVWSQTPRFIVEAAAISLLGIAIVIDAVGDPSNTNLLPSLGALALGSQRLLPLYQKAYAAWQTISANRANIADVNEIIIDITAKQKEEVDQNIELKSANSIEFHELGFRYAPDRPWIFEKLSFEIHAGDRIGIIGQTGCGKSTFVDVFMGLLAPTAGKIIVGEQTITPKNVAAWRKSIAHVPQQIYLSESSVLANIAFGIPAKHIDIERAVEAAKIAQANEFITALEMGYDTIVGERGIRLSGGQRQRIGIARAIYKKKKILILDEATSALDTTTETNLMTAISHLAEELTVLMITHRKSSLIGCNRIISFNGNGTVKMTETKGLP